MFYKSSAKKRQAHRAPVLKNFYLRRKSARLNVHNYHHGKRHGYRRRDEIHRHRYGARGIVRYLYRLQWLGRSGLESGTRRICFRKRDRRLRRNLGLGGRKGNFRGGNSGLGLCRRASGNTGFAAGASGITGFAAGASGRTGLASGFALGWMLFVSSGILFSGINIGLRQPAALGKNRRSDSNIPIYFFISSFFMLIKIRPPEKSANYDS